MAATAVIGTGTWGTATALLLVRSHQAGRVVLLGRDPGKAEAIRRTRRHPLLDVELPAALEVTADPSSLAEVDLVLWAVPTQHSAETARRLRPAIPSRAGVLSLSKGLEQTSLRRVSEVLAAELGDGRAYGCLSGPSHAAEVALGLPICLVAAGDERLTAQAVERLHGRALRLYTSADLLGVELGGALKNVIAIAAGICDGLRLGDNSKAAMITRGVAEMRRLGRALRAQDNTFAGMAGVGDLIATCYSPHGRNRALGLAIARGENPQHYLASTNTVAEGAWTSRAAVQLGRRQQVELPIAYQVASVIWDAKPVAQAMDELLSRAPKEEDA